MSLKLIAAAKDSWACLIRACFRDLKILSMKLVAGGQSCHQVIYQTSKISLFAFQRFILVESNEIQSVKEEIKYT